MRIKYILPIPLDEEGIANRAAQIPSGILAPDTVVDCVPVKNGINMSEGYYHDLLLDMYIVEAGITAEDEGYDAVVMDSVSDSGLYALRSRLSIPVVGPGLVYYHVATMLGKKFSLLLMWQKSRRFHEKNLTSYGLWDKCASIRWIDVVPDAASLLAGKEEKVFPLLVEAGRRCIEKDGAEVILLGSTTMHEAAEHLASQLPVPVINPGPLAIKMAETFVQLGLSQSKVGFTAPTSFDDDAKYHSLSAADEAR